MRRLVFLLALLFVTPVLAQTVDDVNATIDQEIGDHSLFETAFADLQGAVADGNAAAVAQYVDFTTPITVDGKEESFADEADFAKAYHRLFTKRVVKAVTEQDYASLFVNSEGVMFGSGELWLNGECTDAACSTIRVVIIAINPNGD